MSDLKAEAGAADSTETTTNAVEQGTSDATVGASANDSKSEVKEVELGREEQSQGGAQTSRHETPKKDRSSYKHQSYSDNYPSKRRKGANKNKFDPSVLKESADPDEIRKQVEFYFSDTNLPTDNFLFTQTGGSENKPVPIKVIHNFKRMQRFQPFSAVVEALKESTELEVTANNEVRRVVPLDPSIGKSWEDNVDVVAEEAQPRCIYAKGFGKEEPSTQYDIEGFFEPYGPVKAVRLRRSWDQSFKGSVFVEFDSVETQLAFLNLDPKPKFNGETLLIMSKKEYCDKKAQDVRDGKIRGNESGPRHNSNDRGRGRGRGRGPHRGGRNSGGHYRGTRNEDDWKGRREDFQKNGLADEFGRDKPRTHANGNSNAQKASAPKMRFDANGVPIVEVSSHGTEDATNGAKNGTSVQDTASGDKKREREEEVELEDVPDDKKAKLGGE